MTGMSADVDLDLEPEESCGLRWEFGRTWENGSSREGGFREARLCSLQCLYSSPVIRSNTRASCQHQAFKHHRSEVSALKVPWAHLCGRTQSLVHFTPEQKQKCCCVWDTLFFIKWYLVYCTYIGNILYLFGIAIIKCSYIWQISVKCALRNHTCLCDSLTLTVNSKKESGERPALF